MADIRMRSFNAIPPVIKNLIIINALVFFAQRTIGMQLFSMENLFALHDVHSIYFRFYQLITYMFLHGNLTHIFFNMFALYIFGCTLENVWGSKRFLIFYMVCGIGAGLIHLGVLYFQTVHIISIYPMLNPLDQQRAIMSINTATLGASGAVFGCLAAFGYLFPNSLLYIYFLFPIKAKWFVLFYAAMELWLAFQNSAGDNVAHWAHLGGALFGIILVLYWNRTNRQRFY